VLILSEQYLEKVYNKGLTIPNM